MDINAILKQADEAIEKTLTHLHNELAGLQVGRASAGLVENVQIEIYGAIQPIKNVANIMVPDPKTLFIEPWDKANLKAIEKGILDSNLGLNPNNDGQRVILNIPPLTEERRTELTKLVGQFTEEARISVRRSREDLRKKVKQAREAEEIGEDDEAIFDKRLQEKIDGANDKIDEAGKRKEEEMMKI